MATPGHPLDGNPEDEDEGALLVSEFPPPPPYYRFASTPGALSPPPVPNDALAAAAKKAAAIAAKAKAVAEKARTDAVGEQEIAAASGDGAIGVSAEQVADGEGDEGDVVAVFGEIVEDPLLVQVEDECEDPNVIRQNISRLNRDVLQGFVSLVKELVHRPQENKKCRDELSHNIFLMLQECNKFREHQARELLIELLENQLSKRQEALDEIKEEVGKADYALDEIRQISSIAASDGGMRMQA
mmetsp:Transcript_56120/g.167976  ORF Transcript_56120/g.167976 Transcript_56120/m.167976 type:complete len:243 (-) Transcript_56120:343-1071(-)